MLREYSRRTSFTYLPVLTGFFTATLLVSNVLNCKIIRVGQLPFTGGLILFPLVALFGDILTEVYGYAETRKVIWTGLTSLVLLNSDGHYRRRAASRPVVAQSGRLCGDPRGRSTGGRRLTDCILRG